MKLSRILALAAIMLFLVWGVTPAMAKEPDLVIYVYDSFVAEWGPGPKIVPKFENKYNADVQLISVGDAGQVLNRAILEKQNPKADIIVGVDNNLLAKALDADILIPYTSPNLKLIPKNLIFDKTHHITPFDYGYFAICYDSKKIQNPPESFNGLLRPKYRDKIILEDPRTSSPGLGFLLWTISVYGEDYLDFWKKLKPNILTITEGWDTAYGLFTSGEAPMVLSYTTSPAYHVEFENTTRYRAIIFEEGNYMQIEGMGILKGAEHTSMAKKFIDFTLTEDFQKEIPLTNWMFPVNPNVKLPKSFEYALEPDKTLMLETFTIKKNRDQWINKWLEVAAR